MSVASDDDLIDYLSSSSALSQVTTRCVVCEQQQNKQNTICEESIITIEGKEYKQIVRRGKNWVSTYQVACQSQ